MEHRVEISETDPLYNLYRDFFRLNGRNKEEGAFFASKMKEMFLTLSPHHIVTLCMNLDDGIGDYVSQLYFIDQLNRLFQGLPNTELKNISLVSEKKMPIAKIVRKSKVDEKDVLKLNSSTVDGLIEKSQNIVGIPNDSQKIALQKIINASDFIFNLALHIQPSSNKLIMGQYMSFKPCDFDINVESLKQDLFMESWLQYGFIKDTSGYLSYRAKGPMFLELAMGLGKEEMGIRFIDTISTAVLKDKTTLIHSLDKKIFDAINISKEENLSQYVTNNSFAVGYLQTHITSINFVIMASLTSHKSGDMNILVNQSFFESIDEPFKNLMNEMGYTQINLPGIDKDIILCDSRDKEPRILRLFDFKGISEENKACFYGLSEMIASSGDTSFSELVSAGLTQNSNAEVIPFIATYLTGGRPADFILEACQKEGNSDFIDYIKLCDSYDKSDFYNLQKESILKIKENRQKIADSWRQFCDFLHAERNENTHFNNLIVRYTFHHLLKNNRVTECIELAGMLNEGVFKNGSLLHMAVKLNNIQAVDMLINSKICDINQPYQVNQYTALHLAVITKNLDIVERLIKAGINTDIKHKEGCTALQMSQKMEYTELSSFIENPSKYNYLFYIKECSLPEDYKTRPIFFDSDKAKSSVTYKNNRYLSVGSYRQQKEHIPNRIDIRPEPSYGDISAHGTTLASVISCLLYTNKQLVPAIKLRKLIGQSSSSGESQGVANLTSKHFNNKFISAVTLSEKLTKEQKTGLYIALGYSTAFLSEQVGSASNVPVVLFGNGAGEGCQIGARASNEHAWQRMNIRLLAVLEKDKADVVAILRALNIYDIKVCTIDQVGTLYLDAKEKSSLKALWENAEYANPDVSLTLYEKLAEKSHREYGLSKKHPNLPPLVKTESPYTTSGNTGEDALKEIEALGKKLLQNIGASTDSASVLTGNTEEDTLEEMEALGKELLQNVEVNTDTASVLTGNTEEDALEEMKALGKELLQSDNGKSNEETSCNVTLRQGCVTGFR